MVSGVAVASWFGICPDPVQPFICGVYTKKRRTYPLQKVFVESRQRLGSHVVEIYAILGFFCQVPMHNVESTW